MFISALSSSIQEYPPKNHDEIVIELTEEDANLLDQFLIGANVRSLFISGEIRFYGECVDDETEYICNRRK